MTRATPANLAAMAHFSDLEMAAYHHSATIEEPMRGKLAAERFLDAIAVGDADASDAWPLIAQHLHHWSPSEHLRLQGFLDVIVKAAVAPRITLVREEADHA